MKTLVVYDSAFGNTERIAQAIADTLSEAGPAQAIRVDPTQAGKFQGAEMLVLGSPTHSWQPTPVMQAFLANIPPASLQGLTVACFDTSLNWPRWLRGSAAQAIAKRLRTLGVKPLMPPKSFIVQGTGGPLLQGEIERAGQWAHQLAEKARTRRPVTP